MTWAYSWVVATPEELLRAAEDEIEGWLCELDLKWRGMAAEAEAHAERLLNGAILESEERARIILAAANHEAGEILVTARGEAHRVLAEADLAAEQRRRDADADFERLRAIAAEHEEAIGALTAADVIAARSVDDEQLGALREAVQRLRAELSRVVDAAFDALPAVEATADAIGRALGEDEIMPEHATQTYWTEPVAETYAEYGAETYAEGEGTEAYAETYWIEPGTEAYWPEYEMAGAAPARTGLLRRLFRRRV